MLRRLTPAALLLFTAAALAQDAGPLKSGPQPGTVLTTPFHAYTLNGTRGKGRFDCLVCEYGLNPVVLVFARDHPDGTDPNLLELLGRLDKAALRYQDSFLKVSATFLSPAAASAATGSELEDPEQIVKETQARDEFLARLQPLAEKLKHVTVSTCPEAGPKGYDLAKGADVTVILYVRHTVVANRAFAAGGLKAEQVGDIMKQVDELAGRERKAAPPKGRKDAGKAAAVGS
jgi:hypothetical protein